MNRTRLALLVLGAAVAIVVAILVALRPSKPASIPPVPHATTPAQEAQNLETWLRRYSS